jgi:hypothetical protein
MPRLIELMTDVWKIERIKTAAEVQSVLSGRTPVGHARDSEFHGE